MAGHGQEVGLRAVGKHGPDLALAVARGFEDDVAAIRKMTRLWGDEAGQATKTDRILVLGAAEAGRRRAVNGATLPVDWTWPRRLRAI